MARRIVIEEPCEHDKMGKHLLAERRNDPCGGQCGAAHTASDPHFDCPGGSRRVLDPGSYVLIEKAGDGSLTVTPFPDELAEWVLGLLDADALAGGEQP